MIKMACGTQFHFATFGGQFDGEVQLDVANRIFTKFSDEFGWLEMKFNSSSDEPEPTGKVFVTDDFGKLVKTNRLTNHYYSTACRGQSPNHG